MKIVGDFQRMGERRVSASEGDEDGRREVVRVVRVRK